MKSYTTAALGIVSKIWIITVFFNTVVDVGIFMIRTEIDVVEIFTGIFFMFLVQAILSVPILLLLWAIADFKLYGGSSAKSIFKILVIAGTIATIIIYAAFNYIFHLHEVYYLLIITILSGVIATCISYSSIRNICELRDSEQMQSEKFATP